jgi:hypothetical protein
MNCSWLGSNKRYRTGAKIDIARIDSKLPLQGASRWSHPPRSLITRPPSGRIDSCRLVTQFE